MIGAERHRRGSAPRIASFVLLSAVLSSLIALTWNGGVRDPQVVHFGDDADYILTTQSFVNHRSPEARVEDLYSSVAQLPRRWRAAIQRRYQDWPAPSYYRDNYGRYYNWHFWTYGAYTALFKAPLDRKQRGAGAFALANTVAFCAALVALLQLWTLPRVWPLFVPLAFFTPLLWFLPLAHTEPFVFSLLLIAAACQLRRRYLLATLCSALAATQFQPLTLLAGLSVGQGLWTQFKLRLSGWSRVGRALWVVVALGAFALSFAPSLFYYRNYGVTSLIARQGFAASKLMSFDKFRSMFIDLDTGMITYMPGLLLVLLYCAVLVVQRSHAARSLRVLLPWAVVLAALWSTTSALNWNYHTQGVSRYVLYCTPALLLLVGVELRARPPRALTLAVFALAFALQIQVHRSFGWLKFEGDNSLHHNVVASYVLRHWPSLYRAPGEIFCSRTLRRRCVLDRNTGLVAADELPVVYFDVDGRPRKALAYGCASKRLLGARAWSEAEAARIRRALHPCRPGRLSYIDFD